MALTVRLARDARATKIFARAIASPSRARVGTRARERREKRDARRSTRGDRGSTAIASTGRDDEGERARDARGGLTNGMKSCDRFHERR
jgi:hypothetical protein